MIVYNNIWRYIIFSQYGQNKIIKNKRYINDNHGVIIGPKLKSYTNILLRFPRSYIYGNNQFIGEQN